MKTPTKTIAALRALLATERANLNTWYRNGLPVGQKLAEIAGIEAQIAALS